MSGGLPTTIRRTSSSWLYHYVIKGAVVKFDRGNQIFRSNELLEQDSRDFCATEACAGSALCITRALLRRGICKT